MKDTKHDNDACTDFYSFTCSKRSSKILSGYKLKENMENVFSLFISAAEGKNLLFIIYLYAVHILK